MTIITCPFFIWRPIRTFADALVLCFESDHFHAYMTLFISILYLKLISVVLQNVLFLQSKIIFNLSIGTHSPLECILLILPGSFLLSALTSSFLYPILIIHHSIDLLTLPTGDWDCLPCFYNISYIVREELTKIIRFYTKKENIELMIEVCRSKKIPNEILDLILKKSDLIKINQNPLRLRPYDFASSLGLSSFGFLAPDYFAIKSLKTRSHEWVLVFNLELMYISFFITIYVSAIALIWLL